MIKDAFGNNSIGRSSIFEWHKLFKEGREQVEDDHQHLEVIKVPDLDPPDFFLFPRLKRQMKGRRFDTIKAAQEAVTHGLRNIPVENFQQVYADWQTRCTKCVNSEGCYFEEY
ncbi:hypothetical protein ANTPLA_LOCUS2631 [Anthophora plagiata]